MPGIIVSALLFISLLGHGDVVIFSILHNSGYPQPGKVLAKLVAEKGRQKVNHFYAVGYRFPDGYELAWLYWKEGRALILWEPVAKPEYPSDLRLSRRYLLLDRDVVPTDAEVKGSTYLVTRAWADSVIEDTTKRGDSFVITSP
jgi:hypothetical protein